MTGATPDGGASPARAGGVLTHHTSKQRGGRPAGGNSERARRRMAEDTARWRPQWLQRYPAWLASTLEPKS